MKAFRKKFLSILLVVVMVITMLPINILATPIQNNDEKEIISGENIKEEDLEEDKNHEVSDEEDIDISSDDKEDIEEDSDKQNNNNEKIDWPNKPGWIGKNPSLSGVLELESGQNLSSFYAKPQSWVTNAHIEKAQEESKEAEVDKGNKISEEKFNMKLVVFINGKEYNGGNVTVKEGENFSYRLDWGPINKETPEIKSGDYFTKKLFTVKGLNFENIEKKLVIDDINVGKMKINYDKKTGEMTYTVIFTKYINMFDRNSVFAYFQGSSSFSYVDNGITNIEIWDKNGSLTIEKIEKPTIPSIPSGEGWKPPMPPTYENGIRPFVKGVKWDNRGVEGNKDPQIEWRVVFLEKLQKKQREFLNNHPIEKKEGLVGKINQFIEDAKVLANNSINNLMVRANSNEKRTISEKGYCIVEDTLDENQVFNQSHTDLQNKYGGAPFYIELPVMLMGTNHILNRGDGPMEGAGDINGNGAGDIQTYFSGAKFKEIVEGNNESKEKAVKETPMTYTILKKDAKNKREKLIINVGKLGEEGETNLNWGQNEWPKKKLEKNINDCQNKIDQIVSGQNSPISNLKTKYTELDNLLKKILTTSSDKVSEEDKQKIKEFKEDYDQKVTNKNLQNDAKISENDIPSLEKLKALGGIIANENDETLEKNGKYANYKKSLENLVKDQNTFLENRSKYAVEWKILKSKYERTLDFYNQDTGIYGFILKIRSKVIKNSETGFSNDVTISDGDSQYSAHKEHNVKFSGGIVGNFALGSVVLKKADSRTPESNDLNELVKANGLAGAKFKVYCAKGEEEFVKDDEYLAHFIEKEASENGDAYTYTHTGNQPSGSVMGECKELEVNEDGTLILNKLDTQHVHYVVETVSPEGYYVDESPIKIEAKKDKVNYKKVNNVQRSIGIRKIDSYSKKAIGGAEFKLYKKDKNGQNTEITNFKKKTVSGHTGYYVEKNASDKLITMDDVLTDKDDDYKSNLCIHGLDAGTYTLKEVKSPEGYENPSDKEYIFTLPEKYQEIASTTKLDSDDHVIKDDTGKEISIENNSKVDKLSFTKIDGNEPKDDGKEKSLFNGSEYDKYKRLEGAYFSLFRFRGSETDWKDMRLREDTSNWEVIKPKADGEYFTTNQKVEDVKADRPGEIFNDKLISAIKSDENGEISLEKIPKGHYTLSEVKAPEGYNTTYRTFYFESGNLNIIKKLKLYRDIEEDGTLIDPLRVNAIFNFKRKLKLKLVKYDDSGVKPNIDEKDKLPEKYGSTAYKYNAKIENESGIEGVTYKLFLKSEGGKINPNPEEIKTINKDSIIGENSKNRYDVCKAVGKTDKNGILDITQMIDKNGNASFQDGLHMGQYYLIEVATSDEYEDGYILDQTPIEFNLDKDLFKEFPDINEAGIGITKFAANTRGESGVKIKKKSEDKEPLRGAEFIIKDYEGKYLSVEPIEGKENQYRLWNKSSDIARLSIEKTNKLNTDFEVADKKKPSKVENYGKIPDEYKIKTDKNGEVIVRGLSAGKEYKFVEVKAPIGYSIPDENTFKVIAPKTRADKGAEKLEGENLIYTTKEIENKKLKGSMMLSKIDSINRKRLAGAKFNLYKKYEDKHIYGEERDKDDEDDKYVVYRENLLTDEDGELEINDLDWGEYYIQEKEAPKGYVLDESRYHFTINKRSFDENGNSIEIDIYNIENAPKGARRIKINKNDESNRPIKGVKFILEKRQDADDDGEFKWVPYGKEYYETDEKGVIEMVLPVGVYKLVETETTGGHILDDNEILFEVKSTDKIEDEIKVINVVNIKASTAFYLKKTIGHDGDDTYIPLEGVVFSFYDNAEGKNPLKLKKIKDGLYRYMENQNEDGLTDSITTDKEGEIRIALTEDFIGNNPKKKLYYQEVSALGNIVVDKTIQGGEIFRKNEWQSNYVTNEINPENRKIRIDVEKRDRGNRPLEGAEFTLYDKNMKPLKTKETKLKNGAAIAEFTDDDVKGGFILNERYYVKETKAPDGFVRDESMLSFVVDSTSFEKDENGNWIIHPISFIAINSEVKGLFKLIKVDAKDNKTPLEGAEFEIFKRKDRINNENEIENENSNQLEDENLIVKIKNRVKDILNIGEKEEIENIESTPETKPEEWLHYGKERYITNPNGEIELELPLGEYYYIERKAPFGYEINSPKKGYFKIDKKNNDSNNVYVDEKIVNVSNEEIPGKKGNVTLVKYNATMKETLEGAGFRLYCKDYSDGRYKRVNDTIYVTDKEGTLFIDNIPPGDYYLLEIIAPDGYELPKDFANRKHYFKIDKNSNVAQSIFMNVRNNKKGGKDSKGSVILKKIDKSNKKLGLKGAKFMLYYEQNQEGGGRDFVPYRLETFVTNEDGLIKLDNMPIGQYYFEEIESPDGYSLPENQEDKKHYFEISGDNQSTLNVELTVENIKDGIGGGTITPTPDPDKPEKPEPEIPDPEKPEKPEPETPDPEKPEPEIPDPEKPEKPELETPDPNKPEKPELETPDPNKPENQEPGSPDQNKPEKPEPGNPGPNKPEKPEPENTNPDKPENPILSKLPKTGDMSSLGLASVTFIGAGTGLYALRKNKRPMKRNSRRRRNRRKK